jgi:plasmid stability protein
MPISITIRNVPDETRDELAARAARSGRSLQEFLRGALIQIARWPDPMEWVTQVREQKARTGAHFTREEIAEYRDADRR